MLLLLHQPARKCASDSLWPHAWKPATVMPQVGVPFAPEALAVV